jgi:hypothetical protein
LILPTLVKTLIKLYTGFIREHGPRLPEKFYLSTLLFEATGRVSFYLWYYRCIVTIST